ncbi:MAG: hypothetical protein Q9225_005431 [Loekoesia sp. 1 TL-2023]
MPITDPTFQHSDEDWTQITQPRLRKRVQNRVSQRKHRNKVRQQRANSIDAGHTVSAPSNTGHWSLAGSQPSNEASNAGEQQYFQPDGESPKQSPLETILPNERSGFDGFNHALLDACPQWPTIPSTVYPQASSYPTASLYTSSDSSHLPMAYVPPSVGSSKGPTISTSSTTSAFDSGHYTVNGSPYEYLQDLQQWYPIPQPAISPSSYTIRDNSARPSPLEHPQHQSYNAWQAQRTREPWSSSGGGPSPLATTKPLDLNSNGYYASCPTPLITGTPDIAGISKAPHGIKSSSKYAANRAASTTLEDVIEPRGSGINPAYYKSGKHSSSSSKSKQVKKPSR